MSDSSAKSVKSKKRKLKNSVEDQKSPKTLRFVNSEERKVEDNCQWRNLNLIQSIQNNEIHLQKKIELAFEYVNSSQNDNADEDNETVKLSRLIVFLNDWVQSLLISVQKKIATNASDKQSSGIVAEACLDYRCWVIFKFCLEESLRLEVSLSLLQNLLRAISSVGRSALTVVEGGLQDLNEVELYRVFLDCVSLLFLSHGGLSKEHLDLWISTVLDVLQLVIRVCDENVEGIKTFVFAMKLLCLVLEPFAKFLKVHPTQKKGFKDFVDKLFPSLLHLLGVLHLRLNVNNCGLTKNLVVMVEEVLSLGLFHPHNIDGFLSLRSVEKYKGNGDEKIEDSKVLVHSYHRHFFEKLESIVATKQESVLNGLGHLFHVLVDRVKKQKLPSVLSVETKIEGKTGGPMNWGGGALSNNPSYFNAEKRKSLFDFFVKIMEPLLLEMNCYLQAKLEPRSSLLGAHCTLKSVNNLLFSLLDAKLYAKTEDISEGATLNFLKKVYNVILSFSMHLLSLSTHDLDSHVQEILILLSRELVRAIGYIIDIEYEVIESDLTNLWFITFSFLAFGQSFKHSTDQSLLVSQVLELGCQLVKLFSDLRQVKSTVFALSKAIRLMVQNVNNSDNTLHGGSLWSSEASLPCKAYAESMRKLLFAKEFKLAIHDGIKSIPEGQACEFVQQLGLDISCSIEWMKKDGLVSVGNGSGESNRRSYGLHNFYLQTEVFGSGLSELYSLVLNSLIVTPGNSRLLGQSMVELISVIRPYMTILVAAKPDCVNQFLFSVLGNNFDKLYSNIHDKLKLQLSAHWVFVFFFHLYGSFRSLYRQVVGFMPPTVSKKMSVAIGDVLATYAGMDWMEKTDWKNEEYFSWISQTSNSLIEVIRSVSDFCPVSGEADCSPLVYALQTMALQRLVDLNKLITSLGYIMQNNDYVVQAKFLDEEGLTSYLKRRKKWNKCISIMKQEAADLTEYMLSNLSFLADKEFPVYVSDDQTSSDCLNQALNKYDEWDLDACSVNKKSLPTAIWCLLCQNIDIWSIHANKKKLRVFLSHVIHTSLSYMTRCFEGEEKEHIGKSDWIKVTVAQISSKLLTDCDFYEHKFVRRHLISTIFNLLEKSVIRVLSGTSVVDLELNSSPNWQEVLDSISNLSMAVLGSKPTSVYNLSVETNHFLREKDAKSSVESSPKWCTTSDALLQFLCWMPKRYMRMRSFSCCITSVLNLERFLIESSLKQWNVLSSDKQRKFLRLIISCRRALKHIIMVYCEEKTEITESSLKPMLSENLLSVSWLLKSMYVILELQSTISGRSTNGTGEMDFSMMEHTSHIFLSLSKYHCHNAVVVLEKPSKDQFIYSVPQELSSSSDYDPCSDSSKDDKAWQRVFSIADSLQLQTQGLAISLKNDFCNKKVEDFIDVNFDKLSSTASCFSGFLWGVASALNDTNSATGEKMETWKHKSLSKLNDCVNVFADFIGFVWRVLSNINYDDQSGDSSDASNSLKNEDGIGFSGHMQFSCKDTSGNDGAHEKFGVESSYSKTSKVGDDSSNDNVNKNGTQWKGPNSIAGVLFKLGSYDHQSLNFCILQNLLNDNYPKAANLIRQLLIGCSAILRLNLIIGCIPLFSIIPDFICISEFMLLSLADLPDMPQSFYFVCFDGVLKYLQELGRHLSLTDPAMTRNLYDKLIELHLKALGKCISYHGKGATLASHEIESRIKMLHGDMGSFEQSPSCSLYYLNELKSRLRMSFRLLISKPAELHLLSAVQAIERAIVGVHVSFPVIYEIHTGNADGGKVSSAVAAGIDCLDMVLEYTSGRKRLRLVKKHIQSLFAALLNVVVHLRSPLIFYGTSTCKRGEAGPDPGAVILMCIELLTRVCGKHALFELDCWHIAQSSVIPGALFLEFVNLSLSDNLFTDKKICDPSAATSSSFVDRQFSVKLFAACSRLLYTNLKHRKSESDQCIALLQKSTSVLLHCLETVTTDLAGTKGHYFSWIVQEGVKCACFLRRVYEELRQQKDVFSRHCFKFLSDYICIYSGYGPLKTGLRREIDQALRPGVYALIDVCSTDDLQYLHSVFGEGPCRNTLADLQHDYKLNFQYEGKV